MFGRIPARKQTGDRSKYNFEFSDAAMLLKHFEAYEAESDRLAALGLALPAFDYCMKCSHTFNLLDARGAISVAERAQYIRRVRSLALSAAKAWLGEA